MGRPSRTRRIAGSLLVGVVLILVRSGAITANAATLHKPTLTYTSTTIPQNLNFSTISYSSNGLMLAGTATLDGDQGVDCLEATVNPTTLALSKIVEPKCDDPRRSGEPIIAYQETSPTMSTNVRIARIDPASGQIELGPVIATYMEGSDTHLESASGPGVLWLYVPNTKSGGRALRISDVTGEVLQDTRISPALDRPVITANASGLYIAESAESGYLGPAVSTSVQDVIIYHLGIGAPTVQVLDTSTGTPASADFVTWMIGDGDSLWADVCSRPIAAKPCMITRFDGMDTQPTLQLSDQHLTGEFVVGDSASGFFSAVPPTDDEQGPTPYRITRIDPTTGSIQVITTITLPAFWQGQGEAIVGGQSLYLLSPANSTLGEPNTLYRIPIGASK